MNQHSAPLVTIRRLDRPILEANLADALRVEGEVMNEFGTTYSHESWGSRHFMLDRPGKWDLSVGAFFDGRLGGFLLASLDGADTHCHRMGIDGRLRRGEVGSRLMDAVVPLAITAGSSKITLSVRGNNERAQRLFQQVGYEFMNGSELEGYASRTGRQCDGQAILTSGYEYRVMCKHL